MKRDTKTLDLLDALPSTKKLSRAEHPETSKAGARDVIGRLPDLYREARELVARWPGSTASELAQHAGHRDPRHVGRRLPEMVRLGVLKRCGPRTCKVTGRSAETWGLA